MTDNTKSREDLLNEIISLRGRVAELEAREAIRDVSGNNTATEALRGQEEKFRILVENAHEGIHVAQDGVLKFVNPALAKLYEKSQDELLSRPFAEFIHPDDREMVVERASRRARGEHPPNRYVHRLLIENKTTKWVEINSAAISWQGKPAVLVFSNDVTDAKRMEETIRERDEQYRNLVEESFDGIMITKGTKIVLANSRLCQMLGYPKEELEGMEHVRVAHPDYHNLLRDRALARLRGESVPVQYEAKFQRKDGSIFDGEIRARVIEIQGETGVQVWIRDISARKRAEEALLTSEAQLSSAVKMARLGHWEYDVAKDLFTFNDHFYELFRTTADQVGGYTMSSAEYARRFLHPADRAMVGEEIRKSIETADSHLSQQREHRILYADGEEGYITVRIFVVKDDQGRTVRTYGVNQDVTDRKRLERQLLQAQKMEAIGTLAGGIAHDFNNMLTVILGFAELLLLDAYKDSSSRADLQKIIDTAASGASLVKRLLTFSQQTEMKPEALDLKREVERVSELLYRTIPRMISLELSLADDVAPVYGDSAQLEQVVMDLALNARDAMPDEGKLTIEVKNVVLDQAYCSNHAGVQPGDYVLLAVSDSGRGMDEQTIERMFDPFFSTKDRSTDKGTGLGLAVVHSIVEHHNGHITCDTRPGKGTRFEIYFPVMKPETHTEDVPQKLAALHGTETILLVDDEDFVRDLGERILTRAGYRVLTARNGREALEVYQKSLGKISLVVLDIVMPEMGGRQCIPQLLKVDPKAKILISTGYSSVDDRSAQDTAALASGLIRKPYTVSNMLRAVREILDRP